MLKIKNIVLAIPSSGFHSNGFSLVRSILKKKKINKSFKKNLLKRQTKYQDELDKISQRLSIKDLSIGHQKILLNKKKLTIVT